MKKLFIFMILWSNSLFGASLYVEYVIHKAGKSVGVPHNLLRAICTVESNLKPTALNDSDGGIGNHAYGLCQLLYSTAAQMGVHDQKCLDDWKTNNIKRVYANCKLWGPYTNARAAAKYLKYQLNRYGWDITSGIAAYNAGRVAKCPDKGYYTNKQKTVKFNCTPGKLLNQNYVDRVYREIDKASKNWKEIDEKVKKGYEKFGKKH